MAGTVDDLWAIAAFFNPAGSARRLANFRTFRRHLGLPLAVVELAYEADFGLAAGVDAEILLQLRGGDILWQKERLLNLALAALPPSCSKVVWLDTDLVFDAPDWEARASRRLDDVALLQPFGHAYLMPEGWSPGAAVPAEAELRHPPACLIAEGASRAAAVAFTDGDIVQLPYMPGLAWAARRALIEAHGLYDACVVGGGDGAIMRAAFGFPELTTKLQLMNAARRDHYLAWAGPFREALGQDPSFIEGRVFHLWHGPLENRRYFARHRELAPFGFDPATDIAIDASGVWRWNSDKPAMHEFVRDYVLARGDDG